MIQKIGREAIESCGSGRDACASGKVTRRGSGLAYLRRLGRPKRQTALVLVAAAVGAVALASCDGGSKITGPREVGGPRLAIIGDQQTFPFSSVEENPCNGEFVLADGKASYGIFFDASPGGGFHMRIQLHLTFKGTGFLDHDLTQATDNIYHGSDEFSQTEYVSLFPWTVTIVRNVRMVSNTAPDYSSHVRFHMTMSGPDPNQVKVNVSKDNALLKCQA